MKNGKGAACCNRTFLKWHQVKMLDDNLNYYKPVDYYKYNLPCMNSNIQKAMNDIKVVYSYIKVAFNTKTSE